MAMIGRPTKRGIVIDNVKTIMPCVKNGLDFAFLRRRQSIVRSY